MTHRGGRRVGGRSHNPRVTVLRQSFDMVFAGGGLASGLIAYRLRALRPDLRILVVEQAATLGGNHTWSFHEPDLTPEQHAWLAPFVSHRWPRQEVRFAGDPPRVLDTGYVSIASTQFHDELVQRLGAAAIRCNTRLVEVTPTSVTFDDQTRIAAGCVIDGRGPRPDPALALGYQKFLGREVETTTPHGLAHPILMDATVPQRDGYRFVYTLPLSPTRLLIEDTFYADRPDLDVSHLRHSISDYAARQGWSIARDVREEQGVLPIVLAGDIDRFWNEVDLPRVGLRAGLFHPTTGYSLPDAVRLADHLATLPDFAPATVAAAIRDMAKRQWRARGFFRLLNRMLFLAATGDERQRVLARFYRLPESLIRRFYAADLTLADQARILAGKPPVSLRRAFSSLSSAPAWAFARSHDNGEGS